MAIPTAEQFDNALEIAFVGSSAAAERLARQNRVELIEALVFAVRQDERRKMAEKATPEAFAMLVQINDIVTENVDVGDRILVALQACITKVRRQTLLDAAKAMCVTCRLNPDYSRTGGMWWHLFEDNTESPCSCGPIHDLVAQLDAEANDGIS